MTSGTRLRRVPDGEAVEKELRRLSSIVELTSDVIVTSRVDG